MWLQDFHRRFAEATERFTGRRQDLAAVERQLVHGRQVGRSELQIIEESPAWSYPSWWPRLSTGLDKTIVLPADLRSRDAKRRAVTDLYEPLKHIEVVSVVLRFLCPEEFGIISPPVASLLNLPPADNHVDYYLRYLGVLKSLADHYQVLSRVADIDMALWSAAHLSTDPDLHALADEMNQDTCFQRVRLKNLLEGLTRRSRWTDQSRHVFAATLLKHDYDTAAVIAARSYERWFKVTAERLSISESSKRGQTDARNLVKKLDRQPEIRSLGVPPGHLDKLLELRNEAVHRQITKRNAEEFVREVGKLWEAVKWRP